MNSDQEKIVINTVNARDYRHHRAGVNISWSSIFAGVVTFLSLEVLFGFLVSGLGLSAVDLREGASAASAGQTLLIASVIALIVSFFVGGIVAGLSSSRNSLVHGFLTWSLSTIVAIAVLASGVASLLSGVSNVIGTVGQGVASGVSSVASGVGSTISEGIEASVKDLNIDVSGLDEKTVKIMRDTNEPRLQPEYLQGQLDEVIAEAQQAAKDVLVDGADLGKEAEKLYKSVDERIQAIGEGLDRDALKEAVAKNSDLSESEVDKAVDNIIKTYDDYSKMAQEKLEQARTKIDELKTEISETVDQGIDMANEGIDQAASVSIWGFVGLLLSAILAILGAYVGSKIARKHDEELA